MLREAEDFYAEGFGEYASGNCKPNLYSQPYLAVVMTSIHLTYSTRKQDSGYAAPPSRTVHEDAPPKYIPLRRVSWSLRLGTCISNLSMWVLKCMSILSFWIVYAGSQASSRDKLPSWKVLLYVYSILGMPAILALLVGVNIHVWVRERINYPFIFGARAIIV